MTYNPENQFRCTIIRGKAKSDLDNLLAAYAKILDDICPADPDEFAVRFNSELTKFIPESTKKTLDNHRTEIAGKLFGMYFTDNDGIIYCSERTKTFLNNNDQPFFFKDLCFKFQFPNGMDSFNNLEEKINNKIKIRQFSYILQLLLIAAGSEKYLTKDEVAFYVLNSLDVLRGEVSPNDVLEKILSDRASGISRKVNYVGKASSYSMQHINEQLNLLELSNLIRIISGTLVLNRKESESIQYMASQWDKPLGFDIYAYPLGTAEERAKMFMDWDRYYARISDHALEKFVTRADALKYEPVSEQTIQAIRRGATNLVELGDEGEAFVYNYEKERVMRFDRNLVGKVRLLGKTKGLGYDIQSVIAENGDSAEFVKYLEVKSTKRVTAPILEDNGWLETINMTRNEWVAAQQHRGSYFIYRVYFTAEGVMIFVIGDPYQKNADGKMKATPLTYRIDFNSLAVDFKI